jgi:hypothetical protein
LLKGAPDGTTEVYQQIAPDVCFFALKEQYANLGATDVQYAHPLHPVHVQFLSIVTSFDQL